MSTLKKLGGILESSLKLLKRQDTGALIDPAAAMKLTNLNNTVLQVQNSDNTPGKLAVGFDPSQMIYNGAHSNAVTTRQWTEGDISTVAIHKVFTDLNTDAGGVFTPGNAWNGQNWHHSYTASFSIPQGSYIHEIFVVAQTNFNGTNSPWPAHGVYVSVGNDVYPNVGYQKWAREVKLDSYTSPPAFVIHKQWDPIAANVTPTFTFSIPDGTAAGGALTFGEVYVVVKFVKVPQE